MNRFSLLAFVLVSIYFSSIVLAETWIEDSWTNEVKGCGGYGGGCSDSGAVDKYKTITNTESSSFKIQKGKWSVKIYADNIQALETKCCGLLNWWYNPTCSATIRSIQLTVSMDGTQIYQGSSTGYWLPISKDFGDCITSSSTQSLSSISGENEVECKNDRGCSIVYKWTLGVYGFAHGNSFNQYIYGKARIDALVDYQLVESPFDFNLTVNPQNGSATPGNSVTTSVTVGLTLGTAQSVSLTCSNLPTDAQCNFSPASITPTSVSTLTIPTTTATPAGVYTIMITGTGGSITRTANYILNISTQQTQCGAENQACCTTGNQCNTGLTCQNNVCAQSTGGGCTSNADCPSGQTCQNGNCVQSGSGCTQNSHSVSISPSSQAGLAGSTLQYTITVENRDNGTDCTAKSFSLTSNCPAQDWQCVLSQSSLSIVASSTNSTAISVTSPLAASIGNYQFTVTASTASSTNSSTATYVIGTGCLGDVNLTLVPSTITPSGQFVPIASGLSNCDGKKVEFRKDSCTGSKISECVVSNIGCSGSLVTSSSNSGNYNYFACIDKNGNGNFLDSGENNSKVLTVGTICPRSNPVVTINPGEVSVGLGETYTFNITISNSDHQSCGQSTFNLITDCPTQDWRCNLERKNVTISPGSSSSVNLAIRSSVPSASGKYTINVSVQNSIDTKYNANQSIGFTIDSRCSGADIKIIDVVFYGSKANATVENNGTVNLTISSAIMTDKSGKTYNAAGLPISNFNSAQKVNVVFNNVPPCLNFSSVNITTDCSRATKIYTKARCPTETKAIVRIDNVTYDNEIATAFLKNIGSGSIDSNSIRILIDGKTVECKKSFTLSAKTTERCDINFVCSNEKAKFEIAEPGNDTKEFSCIKPINITVESCKDPTCKETSASFGTGENIYIKATTDPKADVKAILYEGTSNRSIDITQPIKLKEPGTYTIALVASKEGYQETIQNIQLTVAKSSNTGTIINFLLIGGLIVLIAGFIYYRLKKTKKKAGFDELYEKYKDKQKYDALYKKYKKVRRR